MSVQSASTVSWTISSNRRDCIRYGCQHTPWNWASHWCLENADLTGNEIVCDLGAGRNPIILDALRRLSKRAFLVDLEFFPSQEDSAPHIEFVRCGLDSLPIPSDSIDVAFSISVLEHLSIDERQLAMSEIERILVPGGRAILTMGHFLNASPEAQSLMRRDPFFTDRHCQVHFPIDAQSLLDGIRSLHPAPIKTQHSQPLDGAEAPNNPLVLDRYADHPRTAADRHLSKVEAYEVGIILRKAFGSSRWTNREEIQKTCCLSDGSIHFLNDLDPKTDPDGSRTWQG